MPKHDEAATTLVSVVMPVHDTPAYVLNAAIASVLSQYDERWELCICDDFSSSPATLELLDYYRGLDPRIRIVRAPRNLHIAGATNLAASLATGRFVGFLDHDDVLAPGAVAAVARALEAEPEADVLYTDEDKIDADGGHCEPYLKPDWSPEHLGSVMYMLHFLVVRKSLFLKLGGLREAYSGAQDYDLALRATAAARKIVHIAEVLYHWRKIEGSAAARVDAKPQALLAGRRALADFVTGADPRARVEPGQLEGTFRVRWSLQDEPRVTLVILTGYQARDLDLRGKVVLVEHFIASIKTKSTYGAYEILVVDDRQAKEASRRRVAEMGARVVSYGRPLPFNFSDKVNFAMTQVETEHVIVLNDDLEVIAPEWIEEMLSLARRPEIGAVGAKLLYPNDRIQHAGIVLGITGNCGHLFHNQLNAEPGYCAYTHVTRNYSAVTAAAIAFRRSVFDEVGGFDAALRIDYNDIDFCLRLRAAGYRIVYTPHAELYHFENSSIQRAAANPAEEKRFLDRWRADLAADPYYNPGLPRARLDCAM